MSLTRKAKKEETGNEDDKQALDDIGYIADLYISNQVCSCPRLIF